MFVLIWRDAPPRLSAGIPKPIFEDLPCSCSLPRSLCALKRVAAKSEHARFGATKGIRIASRSGLYRGGQRQPPGRRRARHGARPRNRRWPGLNDLLDDAFQAIVLLKA